MTSHRSNQSIHKLHILEKTKLLLSKKMQVERLGSARFKEFREASETIDEEIHSIVTQGYKDKMRDIEEWIAVEDQEEREAGSSGGSNRKNVLA